MTPNLSELNERLERCELELNASRGYIKALEYGLHALVATHSNPASLKVLWSHVLPEVADQQAVGLSSSPFYHAAFQQALAVITEQIAGAAERRNDNCSGR